MAKQRMKKTTLRLRDKHTWTARPGYKIFVLDRGAVRFQFPASWVMTMDSDCVKLHDRKPPKDDAVIGVSYMRLPDLDWSALPLAELVKAANEGDERPIDHWGEVVESRKGPIEIAWREMHFIDPKEHRPAYTRLCLARKGTYQALITYEYWVDQAEKFRPVWDAVLESLELGDYIADPRQGPWGKDQ